MTFSTGGAQWPCGCASTWRITGNQMTEQWVFCAQHSADDRPALNAP